MRIPRVDSLSDTIATANEELDVDRRLLRGLSVDLDIAGRAGTVR
jgi:hypothetical protein